MLAATVKNDSNTTGLVGTDGVEASGLGGLQQNSLAATGSKSSGHRRLECNGSRIHPCSQICHYRCSPSRILGLHVAFAGFWPLQMLLWWNAQSDINEADNGVIPLTWATLRTYIQTIPCSLPELVDDFTVVVEVLTVIVGQANCTTTPNILAAMEPIVVSHNMVENYWLEIIITDKIRNLSLWHSSFTLQIELR